LSFFLALCLSSYDCEAADNAQEKERLKYLRQDDTCGKSGCLPTGTKDKDKEGSGSTSSGSSSKDSAKIK